LTGIAVALTMVQASPACAQQGRGQAKEQLKGQTRQAINPSQYIPCAQPNQPLIRIPELVRNDATNVLHGTILLTDTAQRVDLGIGGGNCVPQYMRNFQGVNAVLPAYGGMIPPGYPGAPHPPPPTQYVDPVPGPTLRARIGDLVELTFLNQINTADYGDSIDRGERGQGCDESAQPYPGLDKFPDCFHGSSTGNIHFHGTHTNPGSTGDNVFIEVRPSLRNASGQPIVTEASVKPLFDQFFTSCETELKKSDLSQWPKTWNDFPPDWVTMQQNLLQQYDSDPAIVNKLWPIDNDQRAAGAWPQYYIGATPYCFRLPAYKPPAPTQKVHPQGHATPMGLASAMQETRALVMGQSPGTHWYHAHKHGSTTIDVENGMTGVFIIEGGYDDVLNKFYADGWTGQGPWTRAQPVLVINQLGVSPNLFGGGPGGPLPFSVNGRFQPVITMQQSQVQLWRIANTSSRGGVFILGFAPSTSPAPTAPISPQVFTWKQTAQDGVQFSGGNYAGSFDPNLLIAPGNRADVLVQAPKAAGQYTLWVVQVRSRCETLPANQVPTIPTAPPAPICKAPPPQALLTVNVTDSAATGHQAQFIPLDQLHASFPPFLNDIADSEIKGTKTVVFDSVPTNDTPGSMHSIDGHQFDGNVGQVVLLNNAEEWKIVNRTVNGGILDTAVVRTDPPAVVDHPFHIHINPFQIVDFFDPNEVLPGTATSKYVFIELGQKRPPLLPGQCLLYIDRPDSWKPCASGAKANLIWWDVFPIPSGRAVFINNNTQVVIVPGYFKMRSRFVDYTGQYVLHCHILAHEDRGMMTVVEVVPFTTPYSHQ
jgi:FtsP/CotA-like multicopper oxidase with cupredoxin domain